jgi:hypothetical protein
VVCGMYVVCGVCVWCMCGVCGVCVFGVWFSCCVCVWCVCGVRVWCVCVCVCVCRNYDCCVAVRHIERNLILLNEVKLKAALNNQHCLQLIVTCDSFQAHTSGLLNLKY